MHGTPHYLEILTPDVDAVCSYYTQTASLELAGPDDNLGRARVASLPGGSRLGVRAPLRDNEGPLWRIYLRVDDLDAAISNAREAGAEIAVERMSIGGGHGDIGIVLCGGVEHGFWEIE